MMTMMTTMLTRGGFRQFVWAKFMARAKCAYFGGLWTLPLDPTCGKTLVRGLGVFAPLTRFQQLN